MVDVSLKPGRHKLIHHLGHLQKMRAGEVVAPIHVSVWPTLRCQSKCSYCCCRNENHSTSFQDLSWQDFIVAVDTLSKYGTKALEFSGGGEPLLWPHFSDGVIYARNHGLKLSLITNGYALPEISKDILVMFEWIRVSFQSAAHARAVNFDHIPLTVKVSASYITTGDAIDELHAFSKGKNLATRIAAARPANPEMLRFAEGEVRRLGEPLFFAEKEEGVSRVCYMPWIRAAVDWTGHFLPCVSVHLSPEFQGKIDDRFKLCHVLNLEKWLKDNIAHDMGYRCSFCSCGKENNALINSFINGVDDADFV
jgi:organic radical activating enzyme